MPFGVKYTSDCSLVLATAEGIVVSNNRTILAENGGYVTFTKGWALSLLKRIGMLDEASTKTWKLSKEQFELGIKQASI